MTLVKTKYIEILGKIYLHNSETVHNYHDNKSNFMASLVAFCISVEYGLFLDELTVASLFRCGVFVWKVKRCDN